MKLIHHITRKNNRPGSLLRSGKSTSNFSSRLARIIAGVALGLAWPTSNVFADQPFSQDFPSALSFTDCYMEKVQTIVSGDSIYHEVAPDAKHCKLRISAKLSTAGMNLAALDESTPIEVSVGNFSYSGVLGDDPNYAPGATSIRIPLMSFDDEGNEIESGCVEAKWVKGALTVVATGMLSAGYSIDATNFAGSEWTIDDPTRVAGRVKFADRVLEDRTIYAKGEAEVITRTLVEGDDTVTLNLSQVEMGGAIDSVRPTLKISNPVHTKVTVTNPLFNLAGTVSDNIGVTTVEVAVNGAESETASISGNQWSIANVQLQPGTNTITVRAIDDNGVASSVSTRSVRCLTPLIVNVVGNGIVTPGFNGSTLRVPGEMVSVKAIPRSGWRFNGWTGSVTSSAPLIQFAVLPGTSVQANFIANPFSGTGGSYSGLVVPQSGGSAGGLFKATVTSGGSFSGKLTLDGSTETVSGTFANDGSFNATIARAGKSPLSVSLAVDNSGSSPALTGLVSDGTTTFAIGAGQATYSASNPAPQAGRYTVIFPSGDNSAGIPQGDGYATLNVSKSGVATFAGTLGDGTAFTYASPIVKGDTLPILAAPGTARLAGNAIFDGDLSLGTLGGTLAWTKSARSGDLTYPGGFATELALVGGRYRAPVSGERVLALNVSRGKADVELGLASPITKLITVSASNTVTVVAPGTDKLTMTFAASNGIFSGSFIDAVSGAKRTFKGAVLQSQNAGAGHFRAGTATGYVAISVP
ncbi:MAG: Ig-like domain-containing protein [Chthoniobacteraceae bacterium]